MSRRRIQKHDVGVLFRKRVWVAETEEQEQLLRSFFTFIQSRLTVNEVYGIPEDQFGIFVEQVKNGECSISELEEMEYSVLYNLIAGVSNEEEIE